MRRVVRPGGLIAVKESDPSAHCVLPSEPLMVTCYRDAWARSMAYERHGPRARSTYQWLKNAGLVDARQWLMPIEGLAPFDRATEEAAKMAHRLFAQWAAALPDLSAADHAAWRALSDPDSADNPFNSPDAYSCEANILAVGRVQYRRRRAYPRKRLPSAFILCGPMRRPVAAREEGAMEIQIITIRAEGLSMDERQLLCDECAAVCARIAGVQATEWSINPATSLVCGTVRWSEHEAIAMGTETRCRDVAYLRAPGSILKCRELPCPHRRTSPGASGAQPNTGFVQYPPDYDPRG